MATAVMNQVGQALPPIALQNAAPLAFTATRLEGAAAEYNLLIPIELAVSIRTEVMKVMGMMMMGGMQQGQQPGQGPPVTLPGGELN